MSHCRLLRAVHEAQNWKPLDKLMAALEDESVYDGHGL